MNIFSISCLLGLISNATIGVLLILRGKDKKISNIFGLTCLMASIWSLGGYVFSSTSSQEVAMVWWKIAHIGMVFTPPFFFHFICRLTGIRKKNFITVFYLTALFFLANVFFSKNFISLRYAFDQFYFIDWRINKSLTYLFFYILFYWCGLLYAFILLIRYYPKTSGVKRNQIKYILIGSIIAWLGPEGNFLLVFGIPYLFPYTNFFVIIYPLVFGYAIIKYRLIDIRVAITRAGIFLVLYALVLGLPFYFGYRTKSWFISTSFAVVLASIGPLIYRYLQRKAEEVLLAEQRHYQKILVQAAGGMTREHNLDRLCKLIVHIVKRTVKNEFAAIVVNDKSQKSYRLRALRDSSRRLGDFSFSHKHPLVNYFGKRKEPILYDELPRNVRNSFESSSRVDVIVPSFTEGKLLGFMFLGGKLNRQPYTPDDLNIFKILSHQTALAIENCIFFEEFKEAQERIFTAEKLASIGGMADGVAHQIKNRLNHFSVASGEMRLEIEDFIEKNPNLINQSKDLQETFAYLTKITDSLVANVKRTDGVVKGILNFARTEEKDKYFSEFLFSDLIGPSIELLQIKHQVSVFPLEIVADPKTTVWGVKSQLKEVIYNILDNDYEAIEEKRKYHMSDKEKLEFRPLIKLTIADKRNFLLITISDNGVGIKDENHDKIFAPFFTSKSSYKSGTGIGMYVVQRIIEENHRGKIWFETEYMKGTTFFIRLPKKTKQA